MKFLALAALLGMALVVAGCGGSTSRTTGSSTSAKRAEIDRLLKPIAREIANNPKALAYEAAVSAMSHAPSLVVLRAKIVTLLPRMTAFIGYIKSLRFPTCLRGAQHQLARTLGESEEITQGALPVMATHDEAAINAYFEKAHELTTKLTKKFKAETSGLEDGSAGGSC